MVSVHFYEADSFKGWLVGKLGKTKYVHCAVQIDGKHLIETDAFKKVQIVHIHKKPAEMLWYNISEHIVMTTLNQYFNAPYDYGAALKYVRLGKQKDRKLNCVELCEILLNMAPDNITPDEFYRRLKNAQSRQV